MDRAKTDEMVRAQFRLDTNCPLEDERERFINIHEAVRMDGSRYYGDLDPFFRAIIYHGEMYMCADRSILDWCEAKYGRYKPEWFCKYENLRTLDLRLRESGYEIFDTHVYMIPDPSFEGYEFNSPYEIRWYDEEEIPDLKEGNVFTHALEFREDNPDVIAAGAFHDGHCVAMAGATKDGMYMWQIGIDVLPGYEGKGLAVCLVTMLKDRILDLGKIPYYGTSESHSISMDVGIRSGFLPAFTEVVTHRI